MAEHAFGGDWTEVKLTRLAKYLGAYRAIFSGNEKARHFQTWYVDAFAGTGSRSAPDVPATDLDLLDDVYQDAETSGYRVWTSARDKRQSQRPHLSRFDSVAASQRSFWLATLGAVRPSNRTEVRIQLAPASKASSNLRDLLQH